MKYTLSWVALFILFCAVLIVGGLLLKLLYTLKRISYKRQSIHVPTTPFEDMPSVSVCIPARNEAHAMTMCLEKVLASNYPKLEVLVLDDGSRDNTATLIRAFARDGVRFIDVPELPEGWLGKNFALHTLAKEASSDYLFFLDVDTQLTPDSIYHTMEALLGNYLDMIAIVPKNTKNFFWSNMLGTLHRFWGMIFYTKKQPIAYSAAWLIKRKVIERTSGFSTLRLCINPERIFATVPQSALFLDDFFGISREKRQGSQRETSIRNLAPMFGLARTSHIAFGNFWLMLVVSICVACLFIWGSSAAFEQTTTAIIWISLISLFVVLSSLTSALYLRALGQKAWIAGVLFWGYSALQEIILLFISLWLYGMNKVTWKGRRVLRK